MTNLKRGCVFLYFLGQHSRHGFKDKAILLYLVAVKYSTTDSFQIFGHSIFSPIGVLSETEVENFQLRIRIRQFYCIWQLSNNINGYWQLPISVDN